MERTFKLRHTWSDGGDSVQVPDAWDNSAYRCTTAPPPLTIYQNQIISGISEEEAAAERYAALDRMPDLNKMGGWNNVGGEMQHRSEGPTHTTTPQT